LTDRTEEVAQSAVYLRQMELHYVETNNTESRSSPSPKAEEEDHIIDQLNRQNRQQQRQHIHHERHDQQPEV
jgi:hypothetical protein